MSSDLRACLEGYQSSGTLESSGHFTLNQAHAAEKLKQFRLPEARLYVLNLVASCVFGGASYIDFKADADELWVITDLRLKDVRELEHLENLILSREPSPEKELALALNGCLPLKPKVLNLEVQDAKRSARLDWNGKSFDYQQSQDPPGETPSLKLHIKERAGYRTLRKFSAKLAGGMLPDSEEDAIFRYCNRALIPITFNDTQANRPIILGQCRTITFSPSPFASHHPMAEFGNPLPSPNSSSGLLSIGGRLAPWVTLVHNGVNFRLPEDAFETPGLRGIVYVDTLQKDLSQVQLVQDKTFQALLSDIAELAQRHLI